MKHVRLRHCRHPRSGTAHHVSFDFGLGPRFCIFRGHKNFGKALAFCFFALLNYYSFYCFAETLLAFIQSFSPEAHPKAFEQNLG